MSRNKGCTRTRPAILTAIALLLAMGCTSTRPLVPRMIVSRDVAYARGATLDVYAPGVAGPEPRPVLVTLHGCCGSKQDLAQLAGALAARGALVFNASWRNMPEGGHYPLVYQQAACAVSFARARAASYGGDPGRVALLGWSDGALLASVVANAGDRFAGTCPMRGTPARPDTLIGLAGFFGWPPGPAGRVDPRYINPRTIRFFGGTPARSPGAWADGNPYTHLGDNPGLRVRLVAAGSDPMLADSRRFVTALRRAGQPASLAVVDGASHQGVLLPRTPQGLATVQEVLKAAAGSTKPR
jgi:acetyl esterase/lipase